MRISRLCISEILEEMKASCISYEATNFNAKNLFVHLIYMYQILYIRALMCIQQVNIRIYPYNVNVRLGAYKHT